MPATKFSKIQFGDGLTVTPDPDGVGDDNAIRVDGSGGPAGATGPAGPTGATGATGPAGPGVPTGGTTGQVLTKTSATDYATDWETPTGGGGAPTGAAGGALDGSYPNPGIASSVAGAGLAETSDVLSVNVDSATIEIASDTLRVKNGGISAVKLGTVNLDDLTDVQVPTPADEQVLRWDATAGKWIPQTAVLQIMADAKGDLIAATGADTFARLPVGTNNYVLTADSTQTAGVKWAAVPGGGLVAVDTIWDAKGDLAVGTGADTASKLTVGSDGQVLTADSAQTVGIKWSAGGTVYRVGAGAPSSGLGALNDLYEDTATGDIYQKQTVAPVAGFRSSASSTTDNSTSHVCSIPAGVAVGDLLILIWNHWASPARTVTTPSGWTSKSNLTDATDNLFAVFTRVADGTEGASLTITTSGNAYSTVGIVAYQGSGLDASTDFGSTQGPAGSATVPSITTTHTNDLLLAICGLGGATASTNTVSITGWTSRFSTNYQVSAANRTFLLEKTQASAGASGTATASKTGATTAQWGNSVLALYASGSPTVSWVRIYQLFTSGATGSRSTVTAVGQTYFDTTLGKPIWWNGSVWKDATGTTV